jgi:hypothetical protein
MSTSTSTRRPARALLGGLTIAALTALAGCETGTVPFVPMSSYNVGPSERLYELNFQAGGPDLASGELIWMQDTLATLGLRAGDDIFVRLGVTGNEVLDQGRVATAAAAVAGTPARGQVRGSPASPFGSGRYDAALVEVGRNGRLRVMCPTPAPDTWLPEETFSDPPPGCSNALNRANMAARPRDLTVPRELRGSEANAAGAAVERYRLDQIKEPEPLVSTIGN